MTVDPEGVEERVINDLVDFRDTRVIEVGCGDGRVTRRFVGHATSVLAMDLDEEKIGRAMETIPEALRSKVTFQVADITDIDVPEEFFDVAVLSHSL